MLLQNDPISPTFPTLPPDLITALRQPFAPHEVRLRASKRRAREDGGWECLAVPMLSRRIIETRLDALVPGGWSTASPSLVVADQRIVVCARVTIGPIAHTDYGEVFLTRPAVPDDVKELLWSVPEAFEHAFLRVCARFGLGRYLEELTQEWVAYNAERERIAFSPEQQHAHILKLYQQAGIPMPQDVEHSPALAQEERMPSTLHESHRETADPLKPERFLSVAASATRERIRASDLAWVRQQCTAHPKSVQRILGRWQVQRLEDLSDKQLSEVMNSIHQAHARTALALPHAS